MNENYKPCLYEVSDNWQERWSLIREFTSQWHGIKFRDRKELLPLVEKEETKLGVEVSPSFKEYIMFSADAKQILDEHYIIKYFYKLSVITFLWEHTGCKFWSINKEKITEADPQIDIYQRDVSYLENRKEDGFECVTNENNKSTLTSCIFWLIFYSSHFNRRADYSCRGGDCSLVIKNDPRLIELMEKNFKNKIVFEDSSIYEKENIVSIVKPLDRDNNSYILHMFLWKSLTQNEIPQFAIDYLFDDSCREQGFSLSGVFSEIYRSCVAAD